MRIAQNDAAQGTDAAFERNALLRKLGKQSRERLVAESWEKTLRKGDVVCEENAPRTWLGVLLEGALGVFAGAGARERQLFHISPYDLFGEIEL